MRLNLRMLIPPDEVVCQGFGVDAVVFAFRRPLDDHGSPASMTAVAHLAVCTPAWWPQRSDIPVSACGPP
jgi:hypothetical protein